MLSRTPVLRVGIVLLAACVARDAGLDPSVRVASVTVSPVNDTVPVGATQQFVATVRDSAGSTLAGRTVVWSSGNGSVATVNSGSGVATGMGAGSTSITATSENQSAAATLFVTPSTATLVRVILTPDTAVVPASTTRQFTASARMSDSTTVPVAATFTATGGTISASGLYSAGGTAGTYRVIAAAQGKADSSTVTITSALPTLVRVILSPDTAIVPVGGTRQFAAAARMSDSTTVSISAAFNATGGTISVGGLYTAGNSPGTFRVIATVAALADTATVTVTAVAPTLVRVILTPDTAIVATGATRQFTASGRMSDSTTVPIAATFSATGGTVSTGGLYTAGVTPGTFRVIAAAQSKADTSTVTVTAAPPVTDTLFADGFESGNLGAWDDDFHPERHAVVNNATDAYAGSRYLRVTYNPGEEGGALTKFITRSDRVYFRAAVRFPVGWTGDTKLLMIRGAPASNPWGSFGIAGQCPTGANWMVTNAIATTASLLMQFYSYFVGMRKEGDGVTCYGRFGVPGDGGVASYTLPLSVSVGGWHIIEFEAQANTVGQADGWQKFWLDGTLRGDWNNLTFRTDAALQWNAVTLELSATTVALSRILMIDEVLVLPQRP